MTTKFHLSIGLMRKAGLLLVACFLMPAGHARAGLIFDLRSGLLYQSNVSLSNRDADVESDFAWRNAASAGQGFQLTDDLRFGAFGEVESEIWSEYHGLSNIRPGLAANLRYRFGLGKNAPWLRLETKGAYADFSESRRSGWEFRPGLRAGFGLTNRIGLEAAYVYEQFAARDVVFDKEAHNVSVRGTFELTSSTQIALGYLFRDGDVNSTAIPPRPDLIAIADVREPINTFDEPRIAYRFPATTHIGSFAISQALNRFLALQASYEWQYTNHDFVHYTNHVAGVAIAFSF